MKDCLPNTAELCEELNSISVPFRSEEFRHGKRKTQKVLIGVLLLRSESSFRDILDVTSVFQSVPEVKQQWINDRGRSFKTPTILNLYWLGQRMQVKILLVYFYNLSGATSEESGFP